MTPIDQRAHAGHTAKVLSFSIFIIMAIFPLVSSAQEEQEESLYESFVSGLQQLTAGLEELSSLMAQSQTAAAAVPIKTPGGTTITLPDNGMNAAPASAASTAKNKVGTTTPPKPTKPVCSIGASRSAEGSIQLWWSTANAASLSINRGIGAVTLDPNGYGNMSAPTVAASYTGTVKGLGGTATCVTRPIPTISSMTVAPERVAIGDNAKVSWKASGATSCDLYPSSGYSKVALTGSKTFTVNESTWYTLVCYNTVDHFKNYSHAWKYVEVRIIGGGPSIVGVSGPVKLEAGVEGTWNVQASTPTNDLTYTATWGDESNAKGSPSAAQTETIYTSASLSHTYAKPGTYEPTFYVSNRNGSSYTRSRVQVEEARPAIWYTSAKAANNFEMDAGGQASLFGKAFTGSESEVTKVYIDGIEAKIAKATYDRIDIEVPKTLTAGQTYDMWVTRGTVSSVMVQIKILSVMRTIAVGPAANPAVATSTSAASNLLMARVTLTNKGESSDVELKGIIVQKAGSAADLAVSNITLRDDNGTNIGSAPGLDALHQATLSGEANSIIAAGTSKTYSVYASVSGAGQAGAKTVALDVVGVLTDASVVGTLPVRGARHTLVPGARLVTPTPTCSLSSNKTAIRPGQAVTLKWSSENAAKVVMSPSIGSTALSGSKAVKPAKTTTYKFTFTNSAGKSVSCGTRVVVSKVASVDAVPEVAMTASALTALEEYLGNIYLSVAGE